VEYSVEFQNNERQLGNNFLAITDGGNNNPLETVSLSRVVTATAVDTTIADLRSFQGSTAFNWRFFPGGNYKLYFCTSFSEQQVGLSHKQITAEFTRHPDPQYDAQPSVVADNTPWGVLTQPIKWGATQSTEATPLISSYSKGEVEARRPQSIFTAQNTKSTWTVDLTNLSATRLAAIELFLKQRRGRIPFQFSADGNVQAKLWICSRWSVRLLGQRSSTATDMLYSMTLELRQIFRASPVSAIGGVPVASFVNSSATISEGASTSFTVSLTIASLATVSIPFTLSGTATSATDYTVTASPLTIAAGNTTGTITINALTDAATEGNETAIISLGTPTNATLGTPSVATATITNVSGGSPSITLSSASATIAEGASTSYTLTLSAASASNVTIPFTVSGTATIATDYTITASPITITAGNTTATITIASVTDAVTEGNETVIISLGTPTNATLGAIATCTTTITDASSEDAIVTDWVSRTVTAGGTVATATRTAMDVFVKGLRADSIWAKLSGGVIIPFASDGFTGFLVPLVIPSGKTLSNVNFVSGDYSLATGLDPGATNTTKKLTSTVTAADIFTSTSVQVSVYQNVVRTGSGAVFNTGAIAGSDASRVLLHSGFGNTDYWDTFNTTSGQGRISATKGGGGLTTGARTSSSTTIYRNATSTVSGTGTGGTFPSAEVCSMLDADCSRTAYIYFGAGLTSAEEALHYSRVQALQTSLGRNV